VKEPKIKEEIEKITIPDKTIEDDLFAVPVIEIGFQLNGRFGVKTTTGDPQRSDDDEKKLTFNLGGGTSNTRIFVDGKTPIFGGEEGTFTQKPEVTTQAKEYIDKFEQTKADIVFVIDLSGSMGDKIEKLIESANRFADKLHQSGVDYRLGLVTYEDDVRNIYGTNGQLTSDVAIFKDWLRPLVRQLSGGTEVPFKALAYAIEKIRYRINSKKVLILITDEGSSDRYYTTQSINNVLRSHQAMVFVVSESTIKSEYEPLTVPDGKFFAINQDFRTIVDDLSQRIATKITTSTKQLSFIWMYNNIEVKQNLSISFSNLTKRKDLVKIEYVLTNKDNIPHEVGLRMMIDTFIGDNDGVPFVIPGQNNLIDYSLELKGTEIPTFIQAIENNKLDNPGVIANLIVKGGEATAPDRIVISAWAGEDMEWEYFEQLGGKGSKLKRWGKPSGEDDSAIGLYYDPKYMLPNETRKIIAYYGLGSISSVKTTNTRLGLIVPTFTLFDREIFEVIALVSAPKSGSKVSISLPDKFELIDNEPETKSVPKPTTKSNISQVFWRIKSKARTDGKFTVKVSLSPDNILEEAEISVKSIVIR